MKLAIIIGVVVILFVVFILASYIKAPTDRALIVSGLRKNPKFVIGKSALRIPFLQRVDKLELKMISVDVKTKESVPTNEYINVNIDSAVKIKVGSSKEMLEKAASNFLNKNEDYIRNSVGDVLEGNVREIIGQMRLEDICADLLMLTTLSIPRFSITFPSSVTFWTLKLTISRPILAISGAAFSCTFSANIFLS